MGDFRFYNVHFRPEITCFLHDVTYARNNDTFKPEVTLIWYEVQPEVT